MRWRKKSQKKDNNKNNAEPKKKKKKTTKSTKTFTNLSEPAQHNAEKNKRKRKIPKVLKKAGQKMEWLLKKSGHLLGVAIIKIFNQPGLYTPDSRTCVV